MNLHFEKYEIRTLRIVLGLLKDDDVNGRRLVRSKTLTDCHAPIQRKKIACDFRSGRTALTTSAMIENEFSGQLNGVMPLRTPDSDHPEQPAQNQAERGRR